MMAPTRSDHGARLKNSHHTTMANALTTPPRTPISRAARRRPIDILRRNDRNARIGHVRPQPERFARVSSIAGPQTQWFLDLQCVELALADMASASRLLRSERLQDVDARRPCRGHQRGEHGGGDENDGRAQERQRAGQRARSRDSSPPRRQTRSRPRRPRRCRSATMTAPSDRTRISRCRGDEPTASRTPNSRVRALTENASTPATPTTAISSAMPANPESTNAFSRSGDSTSARTSSSVAARSTGWSATSRG